MSDNLHIYEKVREVPANAQKTIQAGRLKGYTDINPMWRLKKLTEIFGPCGIGWKYVIKEKRLEHGANDEIAAFVDIDLYFKHNGEWSEPIPGTGGSSFVAKERNGMYTSDECFKMALTDAISVACKALGVGADIYWNEDTKYTKQTDTSANTPKADNGKLSDKQVKRLFAIANSKKANAEVVKKIILRDYKKTNVEDLTKAEYDELCSKFESLKGE